MNWSSEPASSSKHSFDIDLSNHQSSMQVRNTESYVFCSLKVHFTEQHDNVNAVFQQLNQSDFGVRNGLADRGAQPSNHNSSHQVSSPFFLLKEVNLDESSWLMSRLSLATTLCILSGTFSVSLYLVVLVPLALLIHIVTKLFALYLLLRRSLFWQSLVLRVPSLRLDETVWCSSLNDAWYSCLCSAYGSAG